ncbi:NUDIX domain-containing protein [Geobacter sp. DSM 9736]|uniref:NUDIX hydrolase n=1 Tax=Geobacter sp. DSM 9736 TaxID=1277350 RepID=UPI000B4FD5F9|nr:NUDIX domain-containing protein [Geobacter sp. DSM 9736]SNB45242.1 ADP-ribose pyrophosphatase YjhB, NUDIX family [Geobacter sp. DSM 9736]
MTDQNQTQLTHCPRCGARSLDWPLPNNLLCPGCGFTLYLNTAAAVAVIIEWDGKILFGVRKNEPCRGMLDLPGGFADPGETAEEAGRREVREEVGIEVAGLRYLCSFPNRYLYRDILYNTMDLVFVASCEELPQVKAADDLAEVLWVDRDAVEYERIAFDSLRRAVRRYVEEFSC